MAGNETLVKGDDFDITNDCKGDQQILSMMYTVKVGNDAEFVVTVSHKDYPDYFKTTGGDKLTVYDNGKDSCTGITNKKTPSTTPVALDVTPTVPAALQNDVLNDGWLGTNATIGQFQKNIAVSGTKITGTLCKQNPKVKNFNEDVEYVLILHMNNNVQKAGIKNLVNVSDDDLILTITSESLTNSYWVLRIVDTNDAETDYDISELSLEECSAA